MRRRVCYRHCESLAGRNRRYPRKSFGDIELAVPVVAPADDCAIGSQGQAETIACRDRLDVE